jgi:AraC-like DNA-binding protein
MVLTKLASIQLVLWNMMEHYQQDPASVFKKVQLDPALMYQPGARYSLQKIAELWEEMIRRINDPCFGLTAAKCWHPSHFGLLGYAMLASPSLRTTLERLIRFHEVISQAAYGTLREDGNKGTLVFMLTYIDEKPYPRAREDAALAWIMSSLRINFQQPLVPVSVSFTHQRPECADKYYEFFRSPVTFGAPMASLEISLEAADKVLPTENKELAAFSDEAMTTYIASLNKRDIVTRVKRLIAEHLPSGTVTLDTIAAELFMNIRKLQRSLQEQGITFSMLLNETRKEIAQQYVQDKNMNLTEVAFLLGYSEQSTFSRAFKNWTGKSPIQYRKAV